jgi:hypothetical protein
MCLGCTRTSPSSDLRPTQDINEVVYRRALPPVDSAKAFCTLADASRRHKPWAADIYDRARAHGTSHTHATRILGRAWSQIIWRLWQDHDTYNPANHTALQRLTAAAT